jgi:hypothetical protein
MKHLKVKFKTILLIILVLNLPLIAKNAKAEICEALDGYNCWYVSKTGSNSNLGTFEDPFETIQYGMSVVGNGDVLYVSEGIYSEFISFSIPGITLKAMDGEIVSMTQTGTVVSINQSDIILEGFVIDGNWGDDDVVQVGSNADNLILRNLEIKNSGRDCVDVDSPENVLVDGCEIHDCIYFPGGQRDDAHGIVTLGVQNFTVSDSEIYYVSGDALQFQYNGWDNVTVENSVLWNGPLPTARGGAPAGANPGEDGIDTKYCENDGRGRLYLRNVTAHGWDGDYVANPAAFNLKHNIDAEIDGVTCYESEICFRSRGAGTNPPNDNCGGTSQGGAWITIMNGVMYNSNTAVRYEDVIENLKVYNSAFGNNLNLNFQSAGGYGSGFEVKNNLFIGTKPTEASDDSNLGVSESDFVDSVNNDYHIVQGSQAVDSGDEIILVIQDRDNVLRPQGQGYDVGAYEIYSSDTTPPSAPSGLGVS